MDRTLEQDEDDITKDADEEGGSGDGYKDCYVPHAYYLELIGEGFEKRSPSRMALSKPAYFRIDDPVTRSLTISKYTAKATKHITTVAKHIYVSIAKGALDDAITANNEGKDPDLVATLLGQVHANMVAIEDMHRDRMLYLDLTSDPTSSSTERDFSNNVLRNDFSPGVKNKGGSVKSIKVFAAYQQYFLRATQFICLRKDNG